MEMRVSRRSVLTPILALVAVAVFAVAVEASSHAAVVVPTLYVNYVGTNCTFTITNDAGANISTIAPGKYQITFAASDFDSCPGLPDFQLSGPGVLLQTPIDAGTGAAADFAVTFAPSASYLAQDLSQPASKLTFTTQASGAPPIVTIPTANLPTTTTKSTSAIGSKASKTSAATVFRGTLLGTVSSSGLASLTFKGKSVAQLVTGKYKVSVVDKSAKSGLVIQELHKSPMTATSSPFVGKRTVTVELTTGQAFFYPTFIGKKTYFVVAAH